MGMTISIFLALAVTTVGYAVFGQGGAVAGMIFLAIVLIGATLRVLQPKS